MAAAVMSNCSGQQGENTHHQAACHHHLVQQPSGRPDCSQQTPCSNQHPSCVKQSASLMLASAAPSTRIPLVRTRTRTSTGTVPGHMPWLQQAVRDWSLDGITMPGRQSLWVAMYSWFDGSGLAAVCV